ncbi:MAG: hypothetical protein FWE25_03435 [Lachnospiraceae bacterium]|nr:hypothetical protein [Lachnospiraceae bacterium]
MKKPNNYEQTQEQGEYTPIELGGHILVIKNVEETTSKNGRPMIVVSFCTAKNDRQPEYFTSQFKNDIRPDKKWPIQGTAYILTEDTDGNCSRGFKTFTTSVKKSTPGFEISWGDGFAQSLKNKPIGGVFGLIEDDYSGEVKKYRRLRWFRSVEGVLDADVPNEKLLPENKKSAQPPVSAGDDGFMDIPDGIDDELPFD